jgi:hypothetical protein
MARKRRTVEIFSLSFLDCICCGFGAMLLLFVLTIGKVTKTDESVISQIKLIISQLTAQIDQEQEATKAVSASITSTQRTIIEQTATLDVKKRDMTDLEHELALLLQDQASLKEELERLLAAKKTVPKEDEKAPIPIPNVQRRQYLTGFDFHGSNVVILVEASGGMLANTVDEALKLNSSLTDEEKRKTVKWRQVVRSVQWVIANLAPTQGYQVVLFNNETNALLPEREGEWFDPLDRETTAAVLRGLAKVTPRGGANLERAFTTVKGTFTQVDTLMLLVDGLPTLSESASAGSVTDDRDRERFFRAAFRQWPRTISVNVILYPMSGDPAAAFLFWQLASATKGALVSPSESWPDL